MGPGRTGRALFQIMGVFAELEREMIRERIRAGLRRAVTKGRYPGRPGGKRNRAVEAKRARILRLRRDGQSIRAIAKAVRLAPNTVHAMLNDEAAA